MPDHRDTPEPISFDEVTPADRDSAVVLVPHTHWDREWYEPFQVFRFQLVEKFDRILDRLDANPAFRFTLDGQTAAIEDYLEIRPEQRARVTRLNRAGRLALGPWQILLDEFLCGGETILRNLEFGITGGARLGGAMPVGYLPDMFGHIAQMPQILRHAGIAHACMWRGVPAAADGHAFTWRSPHGDDVRVEYLFDGYANALPLLAVPADIGDNVDEYRARTAARWGNDPALAMVGTDHQMPHPDLMQWIAEHSTPTRPIGVATLTQYIAAVGTGGTGDTAGSCVIDAELRSHHRGNLLPGVHSIRRPLKEAMAAAERSLGTAERMAAVRGTADVSAFLELGWRMIVDSTAHDSVVGSGTDDTVRQVLARLEQAAHLGRAVQAGIGREVGREVPADAWTVFNTEPRDRTAVVPINVAVADADASVSVVDGDGRRLRTQLGRAFPEVLGDELIAADDLDKLFERMHGRELFGQQIERFEIDGNHLRLDVAVVPREPEFDVAALRHELDTARLRHPGQWRVETVAEPRREVLVEVPVGASGYTAIRAGDPDGTTDDGTAGRGTAGHDRPAGTASGRADGVGCVLANGRVEVIVAADGTFGLVGVDGSVLDGVGALVDGGDRGDSYNYAPPADDELVEEPEAVEVTMVAEGPLLAAARVVRWYRWPQGLGDSPDKRSGELVDVVVTTELELRVDEDFVRVGVEFVNPAANHRLRWRVPLPEPVTSSAAEGQFAVTSRGLTAEGGDGSEVPVPTYPAYGFVNAGPATILLRHASEYEVVGGTALALTLLRAVGMISVNIHPYRDEPAAREIPIPEGQELGQPFRIEFAMQCHHGGWSGAGAITSGEAYRADPVVTRGLAARGGALPPRRRALVVDGDGVACSAIRRAPDGALAVRLAAMRPTPVTATLRGAFTNVDRTDLLGRSHRPDTVTMTEPDRAEIELDPWELVTLRLT